MQARMKNPALFNPASLEALTALNKSAQSDNLPATTTKMVHLRASQINACSVCVDMHAKELIDAGETMRRVFAVAAWRDTPFFSDAERAALALTEAVTRISDRSDPVPDDVWAEATRHYDEKALAALLLQIGLINVWNRLNAAVRQVAGAAWN